MCLIGVDEPRYWTLLKVLVIMRSSGFGVSPICTINEIPTMPWDLCCASDMFWYNSLLKPYNWICNWDRDKDKFYSSLQSFVLSSFSPTPPPPLVRTHLAWKGVPMDLMLRALIVLRAVVNVDLLELIAIGEWPPRYVNAQLRVPFHAKHQRLTRVV